jgi:DNA-binding MarR family transcriptional regulator
MHDDSVVTKAQLSDADYQALATFRRSIREFLRFSEHAAKESGLTPQQHQALLAIRGAPDGHDMRIGQLAHQLMIQHHSAVELVDRLVDAKLVERLVHDEDRRSVLLRLTPKAEKKLAKLSSVHMAELTRRGPELVRLLRGLCQANGATAFSDWSQ